MQLDKSKVRGAFSQAMKTYDEVAELQRRVGQELVTKIIEHDLQGTVLDIGCGTGFLVTELIELPKTSQVIGLDIALPMLHATQQKAKPEKLLLVCADAENLPLNSQSVDHIVSNLALQWCEDLLAVFNDFKRVLKPDGQLLFSTFGSQTLQELKTSWAKVDDYSHVNSFYTAKQIKKALQQTGFHQIQVREKTYLSQYKSVMALMEELKAIGAHNVTVGRRKTMTGKTKMQTMIAEYETLRNAGLIPATFEIVIVTARV
jgi:malonyl-CoA O-methyltransferase